MIKRLPDEDIHTYALRLYENKFEYGLNSESIAELLNKETGKTYGESAYRKFYAAMRKGIEYQKSLNISDSDELAALEERKEKLLLKEIDFLWFAENTILQSKEKPTGNIL